MLAGLEGSFLWQHSLLMNRDYGTHIIGPAVRFVIIADSDLMPTQFHQDSLAVNLSCLSADRTRAEKTRGGNGYRSFREGTSCPPPIRAV